MRQVGWVVFADGELLDGVYDDYECAAFEARRVARSGEGVREVHVASVKPVAVFRHVPAAVAEEALV